MPANTRDRNISSARTDDRRAGKWDYCEITHVYPHVDPYPGDDWFNIVDLQLVDRTNDAIYSGSSNKIERVHLKVGTHRYSHLQGEIWNPRIGDMALVAWIHDREGVVICTVPTVQQEPVCRSCADDQDQEWVTKRAPWEPPERDPITGNFVVFPPPKHPDCEKYWPKTRDAIITHDCPYGHLRPWCDRLAPCNNLDDIQQGTWWKQFSDISPTQLDKPRRTKYHHHCGSIFYFDEDGTIHLENKTGGCDDRDSCDKATPRGQIHFFPSGTIIMRAEPQDEEGAQVRVVAKEDSDDEVATEMIWEPTQSWVRIYKDGHIEIKAGASTTTINCDGDKIDIDSNDATSITANNTVDLTAPAITLHGDVHITGDLTIDGSCNKQYVPPE